MSQYQCLPLPQFDTLLAERPAQIVDIRDPNAFAAGHIPGAQHLHNGNLAEFILNAEFDEPLVVCCYHGISSQSAAAYLAEQGFEEVYSLDGGYEGYAKAKGLMAP
ncbi:thiosulfate sulfurtransferase GlpE [Ferrimonas balearica]|uniref:thiosulfate sulfurtransferase GlpE n=1 Tax=Ferrimonas balearica TaxID=44012 RepID=UPI001F27061B|nr:thiosulfate sulfurtransferase GlpE [Ferrimonas balearica]MBY6019396.1 thiosulfate sulfurtransferase GlpE [Halomonas denitrificans]MBY6096252.1 thiosulfate sulfurtransferase GlpE [Ferrimonas balearica]